MKGESVSMSKYPIISIALGVSDVAGAYELYHKAFGAKKCGEATEPDGSNLHIGMKINGYDFGLAPKYEAIVNNAEYRFCLKYNDEAELRKVYDVLIEEGSDYGIGIYDWVPLGANVTDKYGFKWWLHT